MASWIETNTGQGFTLDILPYGVFSTPTLDKRIGVAIGDYILDMKAIAQEGLFSALEFDNSVFEGEDLNAFAATGRETGKAVRKFLQELLVRDTNIGKELRDHPERRERVVVSMSEATMHVPMSIGDYTDFFVGIHHAQNCFDIIRPGLGLPPNYLNLPVAYTGRTSSIVASGTPIHRPKGQFMSENKLIFGPSQMVDFEVEFAAFIGRGNDMGASILVDDAEDHIFGVVLMNDWSARDIQQWESTPLGPFNGKNFGTTISSWVVPLDALERFRERPIREGSILPYLDQKREDSVYNIPIHVSLKDESGNYDLFECNTKNVIFSFAQMVAHHTVGGCPLRTGDLIATGTLSGLARHELGCLLEATVGGTKPYEVEAQNPNECGISRLFISDGDMIEFNSPGFGSCRGQLVPSA